MFLAPSQYEPGWRNEGRGGRMRKEEEEVSGWGWGGERQGEKEERKNRVEEEGFYAWS